MLAMSLGEDDEPFYIPNLPKYCSSEKKNTLSIIGRILNPDFQKMKSLILDMPRIWKLNDSVRGVALSKEKFQFIFKNKQDLEEIISKGVWSYNEWTIVIDRWLQNPSPDYLQFMPVWVQIRNIPVNHYTLATIKSLGKIIGKVLQVDYNPTKPQWREYVRVRVRFDVSKPLRKSKLVNFPLDGPVTIWYEFERVHKRCFFCQRLSHVREKCPLYLASLSDENSSCDLEKPNSLAVFKESDSLFGLLSEYQISPEILQGLRQYLLVVDGAERKIREEKIRKAIEELQNDDPLGQESLLRLEPLPFKAKEVDKGKGMIFDSEPHGLVQLGTGETGNDKKLLASAIGSGSSVRNFPRDSSYSLFEGEGANFSLSSMLSQTCSTVYREDGFDEATSSGTVLQKKKQRKRPCRRCRAHSKVVIPLEAQGESKKRGYCSSCRDL
ncbi:hypothetical protein AALP_AA2G093400 [Arabis alpina]|uniref:DUF4283 domain-containing protein n=1 Tax=Arabis alpina TaxID=50452 RepID=A0A087HGA8_ARAAL|nr:hypothetical protein AALP_AA2G093400 [Arabis alpina]